LTEIRSFAASNLEVPSNDSIAFLKVAIAAAAEGVGWGGPSILVRVA
jgi:hypothetical protein